MMSCYRMYVYDVWGNARDGYEINNLFRTETIIGVEMGIDDGALVKRLKEEKLIRKGIHKSSIEFESDGEVLYVIYKGKPVFELERESIK